MLRTSLKDEEEDVSRYCMTLRTRVDTGHVQTKQQIAFCGELALKEATDLT